MIVARKTQIQIWAYHLVVIDMACAPVYCVVTPFFPSPDSWRGGYCLDFVKALRKARPEIRVEVFVPGNGEDYEIEGVCVHRFRVKLLPSNILPFLFRRHNENSFLRAVANVGIPIDDIVVCHAHTANFAIYPLALKRLNPKIKALLHHHDLCSFGLNLGVLRHCWLYNLFLYPQLRRLHEAIDCHVFISEASKKSFLSVPDANWSVYEDYRKQMRLLPYRSPKIKKAVILHNGIDEAIFLGNDKPRTTSQKFTIGCIGNFIDLKDQITLLAACKDMPDVKLRFIGSGPELENCRKYASDKGIDAVFEHEVPHSQLKYFYRAIDLFVLPSYFEGFGCVYTEAYVCGVPFISCKGQGIEDLIPEGERHMWLANPKDPVDLANKIRYYMENRPVQHLKGPITFEELIPPFLKEIVV